MLHHKLKAGLGGPARKPFSKGAGSQPRTCKRATSTPVFAQAAGVDVGAAQQHISRRDVLASQLLLVASTVMPQRAYAEEALQAPEAAVEVALEAAAAPTPAAAPAAPTIGLGQTKVLQDNILAYKFEYPTVTTKGKELSMILSRTPEKYSSAAPLTADARQRIVSELFDFRSFVGASMNVGPESGLVKGRKPSEWSPKEVALTVLIDRSTARTTAGQRVALNDVVKAEMQKRNGLEYWIYEHVSQGSPTISNRRRESYRHSLAVTSWRAGLDGTPYLYTLNLSCPEELWPELEPLFRRSVESFTLLAPTAEYIAPDKDPWLFF